LTCSCGYISNHTCISYDCCSDVDCSPTEACIDHECVPLTCSCGYISNHTCISYDCCSDVDCSPAEACIDHECVARNVQIITNYSEDQLIVTVAYEDGAPAAFYPVVVKTESGKTITTTTDVHGRVEIELIGEIPVKVFARDVQLNISKTEHVLLRETTCEMFDLDYGSYYDICWYVWLVGGLIISGLLYISMKLFLKKQFERKKVVLKNEE
ncbi:hypothetical protein J7K41_02970, partial [Candidatus Micrarchaeota archaeon]|nr:hypothetical protein [Candidatus Micrarchaeota archaeon]